MSDLISRADAIDAVCKDCIERYAEEKECNAICTTRELLESLPSTESVQLKQTDTLIIADALRYLAQDTERHLSDRTRADALREQILAYGASMCHLAEAEDTQTEERARFVAKETELAHIEARLENAEKRLQGACVANFVAEQLERLKDMTDEERLQLLHTLFPSAEAVQGWIPFTRRPITEEEQKDYPNCTFMFDCVLPYDGDEILVSNGRFVWMDVFCSDVDGCYLDSGDDIDEDMAWMPLPKPYKGGDDK